MVMSRKGRNEEADSTGVAAKVTHAKESASKKTTKEETKVESRVVHKPEEKKQHVVEKPMLGSSLSSIVASSQMKAALGTPPKKELTHEMIAKRAYYIWEKEGRPQGRDKTHWYQAERELKHELGL